MTFSESTTESDNGVPLMNTSRVCDTIFNQDALNFITPKEAQEGIKIKSSTPNNS